MSRNVNKIQSDILLNRMKENPEMATRYVREDKEKRKEFWMKLTFELNSAGPPEKNVSEWKKVWIDQKRYMQRKASANISLKRSLDEFGAMQNNSPTEEVAEEFSVGAMQNNSHTEDVAEKFSGPIFIHSDSAGQNEKWLKRLNRSLDRICMQQQMQLAEMKRHNIQLEKLKHQKVDQDLIIKRRLLQIKEEQLNLMRQNIT